MKKTIVMLGLALVSWGAYAQHDHGNQDDTHKSQKMTAMFEDENLGVAYENYTALKEALVASNTEEATKAANALKKSLAEVEESKKAVAEAGNVATATSLEDQRTAFATLSNAMADLLKNGEISMGEVYLQYCPMANSNKGGYWLSNEKQIKNPYFGDKMMSCGKIKETIK